MAELPSMPLYTDAYIGDTMHLSTMEHGAYLLLLMAMWRTNECRLPNDEKKLRTIARCTAPQWKKIWPTVLDFFTVEGDHLTQKKLKSVFAGAQKRSRAQAQNARAKWLKNKKTGDAVGHERHMQPKPEPKQEKKRTPNGVPKKGSRLSLDWVLPKDWGTWALNEGWPDETIRLEADKFKDFWISKSGRDATKMDWQATWRNWMRNSRSAPTGFNSQPEQKSWKQQLFDGLDAYAQSQPPDADRLGNVIPMIEASR